MKSKGIKNLLIDLGGVLINLDRQRCMESFKKLGFTDVEERLTTAWNIHATGKRADHFRRIPERAPGHDGQSSK